MQTNPDANNSKDLLQSATVVHMEDDGHDNDVTKRREEARKRNKNHATYEQLLQELTTDTKKQISFEDIEPLLEEEFPDADPWPNRADLDDSILNENTNPPLPFKSGQWIERMGTDMVWHLEPIRRIGKRSNAKGELEYWFKTSAGIPYTADEIRAPREGLIRHFGMRPFLWQQWALLRVECYIRFQNNHERDYASVSFIYLANKLFKHWFDDPRNADFRALYESKPRGAQEKLKHHIFQPFRLMDSVAKDHDQWNLKTSGTSCYQYTALLGSGFGTSCSIFFIQLLVPFLLLIFAVRESARFPNYLENLGTNESVASYDYAKMFETDWQTFCYQDTALDALLMNIVIWVVYTIRVVPVVFDSFYATVGDKDTIYSKINSIRVLVWQQADDTLYQQIGFKLDRYMNTIYIAVINLLMLVVLFLTDSTVDIILNALAIEFVYNFDRDIPKSDWYDPDGRYLIAGVIETIIRAEVLLEPMEHPERLCEWFDVDRLAYEERVHGSLCDAELAHHDNIEPKFMFPEDRLWGVMSQGAHKLSKEEAIWQFTDISQYFGVVDMFLKPEHGGIFKRFGEYYTWSRWDSVLYLPRVPEVGGTSQFQRLASNFGGESVVSNSFASRIGFGDGGRPKYINFDPDSRRGSFFRFVKQVGVVFKCGGMKESVGVAIRRNRYHQVPFRFLDAIFEYVGFLFILTIFPSSLVVYGVIIFLCQPIV